MGDTTPTYRRRDLSPVRIAYLCEFPTLLGGERSLLTCLDFRARAGIEPWVVAPADGALADALDRRRIARVPWPPEGRRGADRLVPLLRERHVQLVHANSLMLVDAAHHLASRLEVPAVVHVRDIMSVSGARQRRLSAAAALIAVSDAVRDWLLSLDVEAERVTRIYNAVDGDALKRLADRGAFRREIGISPETPLVACIGQIALRKGQDVFLDAARQVIEKLPNAHFVIAGARYSEKAESRSYEAELRSQVAHPALAGKAQLLGYRDDVPSILADVDLLVVPSRQEPLSRVLLEALVFGVPAVATDVGGTREIIEDGRTGTIVPPDDASAMAQAVLRLLDNPTSRGAISDRGADRAGYFAPERHVDSVGALYTRVLRRAVQEPHEGVHP